MQKIKRPKNLFIKTYCEIMDYILNDLPPKIIFDPVSNKELKEREKMAEKLWNLQQDKIKKTINSPYLNEKTKTPNNS
jgi:hypothetical protein